MVERLPERPVRGAVTAPLREGIASLPSAVAPRFSFALRALLRSDLVSGIPTGEQLVASTNNGVHRNNFAALGEASLELRRLNTLSESEITDRNSQYFTVVFSSIRKLDVESEQFARHVLEIFGIREQSLVYDYPTFIEAHSGEGAVEQVVGELVAALGNPVDILRARSFLSGIKFFRLFGDQNLATAMEACLEVEATKGEPVPLGDIVIPEVTTEAEVVQVIAGAPVDSSMLSAIGEAIKSSSAARPIPAEFFRESPPWEGRDSEEDTEGNEVFEPVEEPTMLPAQEDLVYWSPLYANDAERRRGALSLDQILRSEYSSSARRLTNR